MINNKIYISGLNMSGKGLLLQLLNGNSNIASFPYHKFGLSCEHIKFKNFLLLNRYPYDQKYFEYNTKTKIKIKFYNDEKLYKINLSELIFFILKNNGSMPYLFESNFSKKSLVFAGDSKSEFVNFDFNLNTFINFIETKINLLNKKIFYLEDLDNIIFNSFLNSTDQYKFNLLQYKYYSQWASNNLNETLFLLDNYINIKIIYVHRDLISSSYSIAKRMASRDSKITKNVFKKLMFQIMYNRKIKEDIFFNNIKKLQHKNKLLIINFNDLFNNKNNTITTICNFLNIKFEENMLTPHMLSDKITGLNFHKNNMNDDPSEIFSKSELNKITNIQKRNSKLYFYKNLYRILF